MKTDSAGNSQWIRVGTTSAWGGCIKPTPDGGYVFATRDIGANGHAITIVKTDSLGLTGSCNYITPTVTVTNVADTVISIPVTDSVLNVTTTPVTITTTNMGNVYDICPTGLQSVADEIELSVFPNPAQDKLTVRYTLGSTKNAAMVIRDVLGQEIMRRQLRANSNEHTFTIKKLPAGVYFIQILTDSEKQSGKFVKQ